jgi:hypothetical protein
LQHISSSIEKIKIGDPVLSLNLATMEIENDIVKQIDSIRHREIVHISFSDMTENKNTYDHPYWEKNKTYFANGILVSNESN